MALQNFVDRVGPAVSATWLNVVDALKYTVFADAATKANARAALVSDAVWTIAQGGTGAVTAAAARAALMSSPLEVALGGTGVASEVLIGSFRTETNVASAASTDIGAATSHTILITGTTNIS